MINKDEITKRVAFSVETINKKTTEEVIDALLLVIADALKKDEDVRFKNFGTFVTNIRKGRIGVNPRNPQEKIEIPDVKVIKFKPSQSLKREIKNG